MFLEEKEVFFSLKCCHFKVFFFWGKKKKKEGLRYHEKAKKTRLSLGEKTRIRHRKRSSRVVSVRALWRRRRRG